jgi:ATP-dependent protease Clp ATPase subunit
LFKSKFPAPDNQLVCSFCHKNQDGVRKLISSPGNYPRAYICDECIAVCNSILEDDKPVEPYVSPTSGTTPTSDTLDAREQLHSMLDEIPQADVATVEKFLLDVIRSR